MKLQLKINNEWAVLPEGISMSIHKASPLFDTEAGDISYPFELNLEANRHIFKNLADTHGYIRLREFHGLSAEIWYDGMQVFIGQTEVEDSIDFDGENISINIISANKTFAEMIDGMNCRDVEVKDEVVFGWMTTPYTTFGTIVAATFTSNTLQTDAKLTLSELQAMSSSSLLTTNYYENQYGTSEVEMTMAPFSIVIGQPKIYFDTQSKVDAEYPSDAYCNFRLVRPKGDGANQSEDATGNGYAVTEPGGINCAPNFFVLYFLDCLFTQLGIECEKATIDAVEDLRRLFMLNVWPDGEPVGLEEDFYIDDNDDTFSIRNYFYGENGKFPRIAHFGDVKFFIKRGSKVLKYKVRTAYSKVTDLTIPVKNAKATSRNFPDVDVQDVVDSLAKGFGVVFDYNQETKHMTLSLKRDIMRNSEVYDTLLTVADEFVTRQLFGGVELTYGNDDDTAYNYDMTENADGKVFGGKSEVTEYDDYSEIVSSRRSRYDTETKYDKNTGNSYRIKVNENTGDEPQLFEVGGYNPCKYGVDKDGTIEPETIEIPFIPVTINDIWGWRTSINNEGSDVSKIPQSEEDSETAVFNDTEDFNTENDLYPLHYESLSFNESRKAVGSVAECGFEEIVFYKNGDVSISAEVTVSTQMAGEGSYDLSNDENPLANADVGLQFGIIRGSGADAHMEYINNYDGEGNDTWLNIPGSKGGASADSVTMWGTPYDYNGTEQGGTDGHLSLKLDARKVKSYDENGDPVFYPMDASNARRGLVPQLLEEYLYFLAHKTPVTLKVHGTLTELLRLPFLKRVKIGDHIGFIYTIDFDIEEDGVQEATIVLWELNK